MRRPYSNEDDAYQIPVSPQYTTRASPADYHTSSQYIGPPHDERLRPYTQPGYYGHNLPYPSCMAGPPYVGEYYSAPYIRPFCEETRLQPPFYREYERDRYEELVNFVSYPPTQHLERFYDGRRVGYYFDAFQPIYYENQPYATPPSSSIPLVSPVPVGAAPLLGYATHAYPRPSSIDTIQFANQNASRDSSDGKFQGERIRLEPAPVIPAKEREQNADSLTYEDTESSISRNEKDTVKTCTPQTELPCRMLFIRNVSTHASKMQVTRIFERYGPIRVIHDQHIVDRGVVFVAYYDLRHAEKAKDELQGFTMMGRKWDVHYSMPRNEDEVSGPCTDEKHQGTLIAAINDAKHPYSRTDLNRLFGKYGDLRSVRDFHRIPKRKFIEYYDERDCRAAFGALNGAPFKGGHLKLYYSWDYPRELRISLDRFPNDGQDLDYKEETISTVPVCKISEGSMVHNKRARKNSTDGPLQSPPLASQSVSYNERGRLDVSIEDATRHEFPEQSEEFKKPNNSSYADNSSLKLKSLPKKGSERIVAVKLSQPSLEKRKPKGVIECNDAPKPFTITEGKKSPSKTNKSGSSFQTLPTAKDSQKLDKSATRSPPELPSIPPVKVDKENKANDLNSAQSNEQPTSLALIKAGSSSESDGPTKPNTSGSALMAQMTSLLTLLQQRNMAKAVPDNSDPKPPVGEK